MLLKFTVSNFRSIRDTLELDFIADERLRSEREPDAGVHVESRNLQVLPVIALFGQNGAGKSTVLYAMLDFMMCMLLGKLEDHLICEPFAFDPEKTASSTKMSASVLVGGKIYEYELAFTRNEVNSETLWLHGEGSKKTKILSRQHDGSGKAQWFVNECLGKHRDAAIALTGSIKRSVLYLPLLWDTFDIPELKDLSTYLRNWAFPFTPRSQDLFETDLLKRLRSDKSFAEDIRRFLCLFDIGIDAVSHKGKELYFHHKAGTKSVPLNFDSESDGTRQLTIFSGTLLQALRTGQMLIVDELDSHLHPMITHQIVSLFQNRAVNQKNAQLVFSTHDTTLLDQDLLRRDQIYLVNRDGQGATSIDSLTSYHVRKDLALQKAYLEGRLSGLPTLKYMDQVHDAVRELIGSGK